MNHRYENLTGKVFGRLKVLSWAFSRNKQTYWKCICKCGKEKSVSRSSLIRGKTLSCGCYNADKQKTHGMTNTRLHNIWALMRARCERKSCPAYKNYGGRGITVCKEWNDFCEFYKWAKNNGYKESLTIDRIDVNGNYSPKNCRWVSMKEQRLNKRDSLMFFGEPLKITCKRLGLSYKLVWKYKNQNRSVEESVLKALKTRIKKITCHIQRLADEEQTHETEQEIAELKQERSDKVEEIKERYPYPVENDPEYETIM